MAISVPDAAAPLLSSTPFLLALVIITLSTYAYNRSKHSPFPIVNSFPGDFTKSKAHAAYLNDAKQLIAEGLAKHNGPITLDTPSGPQIVLPASMMEWVRTSKDVDHQALVLHQFFGTYPGFEAQKIVHDDPDNLVINMIKKKLSQNGKLVPILSEHIGEALDELWGREAEWHEIAWFSSTMGIIARAAASVFAGARLSRNAEWQKMTTTYATVFFGAAFELMRWPAWTRPVVHWFLPGAQNCRTLMRDVRGCMKEELEKREQEKASGEYPDAIAWTEQIARDTQVDHAAIQLSLAMAAYFTTSESLRQLILDLCEHPEMIAPLREEVRDVFRDCGMTAAAVAKMHLVESFMKESQRVGAPSVAGLERLVMRDTKLPDGTHLPRGSVISVDQSEMWNSKTFPDPEKFDGYRYHRMREAGDEGTAFVSSTKEHSVFGMGKHVCPGRFLAAAELKLCLAHILLKYDLRLQDGYRPRPQSQGFARMVDMSARVEIRRRHGDVGI